MLTGNDPLDSGECLLLCIKRPCCRTFDPCGKADHLPGRAVAPPVKAGGITVPCCSFTSLVDSHRRSICLRRTHFPDKRFLTGASNVPGDLRCCVYWEQTLGLQYEPDNWTLDDRCGVSRS